MSGLTGDRIQLKRCASVLVKRVFAGALILAALPAAAGPEPVASVASEPQAAAALPGVRRLNEVQYGRAIEQAFGPGIKVPGRFDPPLRDHGLMAIGATRVTVSPAGLEQYELRARLIAHDAMAAGRVKIQCQPAAGAVDQGCARLVLNHYGRLLYRRPLSQQEADSVVVLASEEARRTGSFANGLELGLSRLMMSPYFIFRVERSDKGGRLDGWSLASRISFLLWDAPPDEALLDAVARGDMADPQKRTAQIDRMIASPRFEQGVRSFFFDMFGYEQFAGLVKDQAIYPKFNSDLVKDAQEQTLRTVVDLLLTKRGDYRDLFTTRQTFMNRNLAALYRVPVSAEAVGGWATYAFPANEPRAGILSLAAFLMLDPTHEGKSSPTIRGKTVRELLLCQQVPAPPPNVNFSIVQDDTNPLLKTARQRLIAHQENPVCKGCHAITDPIGLSLENYDALGSYRSQEHGALIDASGSFMGKPYSGLTGLTSLLRDDPQVPACAVQRVFEYGVGRESENGDSNWLSYTNSAFANAGYRLPALMRLVASSEAFASASAPNTAQPTDSNRRTR